MVTGSKSKWALMKISYLLQLTAFPLAVLLPPVLIILGWDWQAAALLAAYPWGVGILAALWDYIIWRRL